MLIRLSTTDFEIVDIKGNLYQIYEPTFFKIEIESEDDILCQTCYVDDTDIGYLTFKIDSKTLTQIIMNSTGG